jgi:transposase
MAALQASPAPAETAPENERAGVPQDQREASEARSLTVTEQRRQISRANRLARYEQLIALHREGLSLRAIARHLHVSRKVVHRSVRAGTFPERVPTGRRQSKLDPYLPYLRKRWEEGCHNSLQLARELDAQGFRGSASLVRRLTGDWRTRLPGPAERARGKKRQAAPPVKRHLSPRHASWLFVTDQQQLTTDQRALIERICHTNADLLELDQLGQDFVQMAETATSTPTGRLACSGSPEFLGGTAGICFWHQARLRRAQSRVGTSMESGTGGGADYAPQILEKANVWASSF